MESIAGRSNRNKLSMSTNVLYIDTSSNEKIIVSLTIDGKEYKKEQKIDHNKAQVVLPMIDAFLKEKKMKLSDIHSIEVHPGPGSFTGVRVGVSIANALSFALRIPINGRPLGEFVIPVYD